MADHGYSRPEMLAEPDWLVRHQYDSNVRLLDCGQPDAYSRAHIPGAVGLPVHHYLKDRDDERFVMPPDQIAELMGSLGVGDDTTVVTYDDMKSLWAARVWWVLRYYGHANVKVLNGGWHRWLAEGRAITAKPFQPPPATFTPTLEESLVCRLDDLKATLSKPNVQVLDVRSDAEWTGENDRGNHRRGHVPGAVHLEWLNFVTDDDRQVFLPADELRARVAEAGITPESEVVTY